MLSGTAELSSLNNMSKAENSSCRHKLKVAQAQYLWYLLLSIIRDDLSSQKFPPHFHVAILFCDFVKTENDDKSLVRWPRINPEVMMILLIISKEFGFLEVDYSSTSHSKEWKLFYVNEIKKMTKRINLKIFPRNFRLLLRCRL